MPGGREVLADDLGKDACAGPDADAGHGRQDLGKRVFGNQFFDLFGDLGALLAQPGELGSQAGQDDAGGVGAGDYDGLLGQRGEDLLGQPGAETGRAAQQSGAGACLARLGQSGWGGPGLEQV